MKNWIGIIIASLLVLAIADEVLTMLSFGVYLKQERPEIYRQMVDTIEELYINLKNEDTEANETLENVADLDQKNIVVTESEKDKSDRAEETLNRQSDNSVELPITGKNKAEIPVEELKAKQRTDRVPIEGTGQEVDVSNILTETGDIGENYAFPEVMYPYRAMLNSEHQKIYNQVYANAVGYNSDPFALQTTIITTEMDNVMSAVYNDHPELFWLETRYKYQYGRNRIVYTVELSFNETMDNIDENVSKFNERVKGIVQMAEQYETDVEKEKYVHDYLVDAVTYDETAPMHQSAFSALVNGRSVCAGYSRAFQHILVQMGIPTYYCAGLADGGPHAWNIVKLGNGYYNVDSLWDDSIGEDYNTYCYLYFNIPDIEFNDEHRRTELSINLPACNVTEMSYEAVFGNSAAAEILSSYGLSEEDVLQSLEEYYSYCEESLTRAGLGESSFTVALANEALYNEISQDFSRKGYVEGYMKTVVQNLGLTNSSMSINFSVNELPNGYFILTQDTNLMSE